MQPKTLEDILKSGANPERMLRNSGVGAYVYPVVPTEFSNWRDEQLAWRETCVLFDQSHHMVEILVEGAHALRLLAGTAINSFAGFPVDRAKQYVACNHDGYVIGDGILFHLAENRLVFVGRAPAANWIEFHAASGAYDVTIQKDDRSPGDPKGRAVVRRNYRFQVQGPNAWLLLEKLNGTALPDIPFFHMGYVAIAGRRVRALRHGMAGSPGLEIWGPYDEREEIRVAILEAGREFGLRQVGSRAYATNTLESGWIPSPLPAVYTGEAMKSYREWLPSTSYEASGSLGGSFVSDDIEDYYLTPFELGYGGFIRFDHDFIGRKALEAMAGQPHRRKVTFVWHPDDVIKVFRSMLDPAAGHYKYIDWPLSNYASASFDRIERRGKMVGASMFAGYSHNERAMLSLGVVDPDVEAGAEVTLVWGEENGGTTKTTVERHRQLAIRARVASAPYSKVVRETYAAGWRNA